VTEEINPTSEEENVEPEANAVEATSDVASQTTEAGEAGDGDTAVAAPEQTAAAETSPRRRVSITDPDEDGDDDDDDFDDDDDDDDDDDGPRYMDGPAEYVQRERRGRGRRVGSDIRVDEIDYKNIALLTRFLDRRGRILSRRKTRVSAKVQRRVVREIKRARHLALLPYTADQTRIVRKRR